jgi:hypothetical protein
VRQTQTVLLSTNSGAEVRNKNGWLPKNTIFQLFLLRFLNDSRLERVARSEFSPAAVLMYLAGDLDNIVLKALRKEPERRYHSAEALSEDTQEPERTADRRTAGYVCLPDQQVREAKPGGGDRGSGGRLPAARPAGAGG